MIIHSKLSAAESGAVGLDVTFSGTLLCRVSPVTFADAATSLSLELEGGVPIAVGTTGWWTVAKEMADRAAKGASKREGLYGKLDLQQAKTPGQKQDGTYPEGTFSGASLKRLDVRAYDGRSSKASVIGSVWVATSLRAVVDQEGVVPLPVLDAIEKAATDGDVYERRACGRLVATGITRLGGKPICLHKKSGRYFVPVKCAETVLRALNALVTDSRGEFTYMATSIFPDPAQVAPVMTGAVFAMETRLQDEIKYFGGIDWGQPRQANAAGRRFTELQSEFEAYECQMKGLLGAVEKSHGAWVAEITPHLEEWGDWATGTLSTLKDASQGRNREARLDLRRGYVDDPPVGAAAEAVKEREAEVDEIASRSGADVEDVSWDSAPEPEAPEADPPVDGIEW